MARPTNASKLEQEVTPSAPIQELIKDRDVDPRELAAAIRANRAGDMGNLSQKLPFYGEKPGWKRRWVLSANVPMRIHEGYRFVTREQVQMKSTGIGFGNSSLGDTVTVPSGRGEVDQHGKESLLHLMEVPEEIAKEMDWEKSGKQIQATTQAVREGRTGMSQSDHSYVPKHTPIRMDHKPL